MNEIVSLFLENFSKEYLDSYFFGSEKETNLKISYNNTEEVIEICWEI
jgi:hypothetical protein